MLKITVDLYQPPLSFLLETTIHCKYTKVNYTKSMITKNEILSITKYTLGL